ncbi:TlyA family RNA methyltransferase [Litorimonas sp. RW-G-Af-16]|uniref:TlyA family RNA methyltransferase n=1 Tax=Litorimonas sp. RW-G-Af-16 TaxID=3241168 RepID=UPI00390C85D3
MRADLWLVANGHYESRARAQAAIKAGLVTVGGQRVKKPSESIADDADVSARHEHPWVSRGGLKLVHALKTFSVNPKDKICLDVGSSTGGFCDVLLSSGAAHIYAVDVGQGQLHQRLQGNKSITSMEQQDSRTLTMDHFGTPPQLIVCDVSFISAMKALETPLRLAAGKAELTTLVKPQFEVGKSNIGRGGIVQSESLALQSLSDVAAWVTRQGWDVIATCQSPIKGGSGNTEYLLHARRG